MQVVGSSSVAGGSESAAAAHMGVVLSALGGEEDSAGGAEDPGEGGEAAAAGNAAAEDAAAADDPALADIPAAVDGEAGEDRGEAIDADMYFGFEITDVRQNKELASLGKYTMDIVTPPEGTIWGQFNDRRIDPGWVKKLHTAFKGIVDNCVDSTTIDVIVKRGWVTNLPKTFEERLQRVDGMALEKVPKVEFSPEGLAEMAREGLWVLGGNHRHEALKLYIAEEEQKLEEAKGAISKIQKSANATGNVTKATNEAEKWQKVAHDLEKKIARSRRWVVNLYDKGALLQWSELVYLMLTWQRGILAYGRRCLHYRHD